MFITVIALFKKKNSKFYSNSVKFFFGIKKFYSFDNSHPFKSKSKSVNRRYNKRIKKEEERQREIDMKKKEAVSEIEVNKPKVIIGPEIVIKKFKLFNYNLFQVFNKKTFKKKFFVIDSKKKIKRVIVIKFSLLSDFFKKFYIRKFTNEFYGYRKTFNFQLFDFIKSISLRKKISNFKKKSSSKKLINIYDHKGFKFDLKRFKNSYWRSFRLNFSIRRKYDYKRILRASIYKFFRIYLFMKSILIFSIKKKIKFKSNFFKIIKKLFRRFIRKKRRLKKRFKKNWIKRYKRKFSTNKFFFVRRVLNFYPIINSKFKNVVFFNIFKKIKKYNNRLSKFFFSKIFFVNNYYSKKRFKFKKNKRYGKHLINKPRRFYFSSFSPNFFKIANIINFFRGYRFRKLRYIQFTKSFNSFPFRFKNIRTNNLSFKYKKFKFFNFLRFFNVIFKNNYFSSKNNLYNLFFSILKKYKNISNNLFNKNNLKIAFPFFKICISNTIKNIFFIKNKNVINKFIINSNKKNLFFSSNSFSIYHFYRTIKKIKNRSKFKLRKLRERRKIFKLFRRKLKKFKNFKKSKKIKKFKKSKKIKKKIVPYSKKLKKNKKFVYKTKEGRKPVKKSYKKWKHSNITFLSRKKLFFKKLFFFIRFYLTIITKKINFSKKASFIKSFFKFFRFFFRRIKKKKKMLKLILEIILLKLIKKKFVL
jgi:hypothetical protein